jgi:hypothetical protein
MKIAERSRQLAVLIALIPDLLADLSAPCYLTGKR